MVHLYIENDADMDMIVYFCNLKTELIEEDIKRAIEKIAAFYHNFSNEKNVVKFIQNILTACKICHQQSFVFPFYLNKIISNLPKEKKDLFHSSLLKVFESNYKTIYYSLLQKRATLFAMLIRESILSPDEILNIIYEVFTSNKRRLSKNEELFTIQLFFFAGDLISAADKSKTKKILNILDRRRYNTRLFFANDFWISKCINTPGLDPTNFYSIFRFDDVNSLQSLASNPGFDINMLYPVPIWELDPIMIFSPNLINAAIFYGAEKCFRFLYVSGAKFVSSEDDYIQLQSIQYFYMENLYDYKNDKNYIDAYINSGGLEFQDAKSLLATDFDKNNKEVFLTKLLNCLKSRVFYIRTTFPLYKLDFPKLYLSFCISIVEYAIAGNNFHIIATIDNFEDHIKMPSVISIMYNREKEREYFVTSQLTKKEYEFSLHHALQLNDNHIAAYRYFEKIKQQSSIASNISPHEKMEQIILLKNQLYSYSENLQREINCNFLLPSDENNLYIFQTDIYDHPLDWVLFLFLFKNNFQKNPRNDDIQDLPFYNSEFVQLAVKSKHFMHFLRSHQFDIVDHCIKSNFFESAEFLLKLNEVQKTYTRRNLLSHCKSIEMRAIVRKYIK